MKRIIGGFAALAFLLVLASCGGKEADVVGKWKIDVSSIDVTLGDGIPAEMKSMMNGNMSEMKSADAQKEADQTTFDFQEGGKLVISKKGDDEKLEGKWSIDGDYMIIEGEIEGMKGKLKLMLDEVSGDKMTVSLTGEEILAQLKAQQPGMVEMMKGQGDLDKMAKGTKVSVSFKK